MHGGQASQDFRWQAVKLSAAHWAHRSLGLLYIGHFAVILNKVETVDIIIVSTEETGLGTVCHLPTVLVIQSGF